METDSPAQQAPTAASNGTKAPFAGAALRVQPDYVWMPELLRRAADAAWRERPALSRIITPHNVQIALDYHERQGKRTTFASVLVELGILTQKDVAVLISHYYKFQFINLPNYRIQPEVCKLLPDQIARRRKALPIARSGGKMTVVIADPAVQGFAEVQQMLNRHGVQEYDWKVAPEGDILAKIDEVFTPRAEFSDPARFVDDLVRIGVERGVSDIHITPAETHTQIRFRIDGYMMPYVIVDAARRESLTARLKIRGQLDIGVSHLPLDGRASGTFGSRKVNLRFSSIPVLHGENIVIRILDQSKGIVPLEELGMLPDTKAIILEQANADSGFTYIVAPTGSGKTTTLYAILDQLNTNLYVVKTLEDPIEYELRGIDQTEITEELTFALGLRALLRQDPDYILVGETRDRETADLSMRASLTGHNGFSTLHGSSCSKGVLRLLEMGVEPSVFVAGVPLLVAQRLVRRLCPKCARTPDPRTRQVAKLHDIPLGENETFWKTAGCEHCGNTGYKGRLAVFEVRPVAPFADLILGMGAASGEAGQRAILSIEARARELYAEEMKTKGVSIYRTLRDEAFMKAKMGLTSIDEVFANT